MGVPTALLPATLPAPPSLNPVLLVLLMEFDARNGAGGEGGAPGPDGPSAEAGAAAAGAVVGEAPRGLSAVACKWQRRWEVGGGWHVGTRWHTLKAPDEEGVPRMVGEAVQDVLGERLPEPKTTNPNSRGVVAQNKAGARWAAVWRHGLTPPPLRTRTASRLAGARSSLPIPQTVHTPAHDDPPAPTPELT